VRVGLHQSMAIDRERPSVLKKIDNRPDHRTDPVISESLSFAAG